jgi:site-specific recombinase XerD
MTRMTRMTRKPPPDAMAAWGDYRADLVNRRLSPATITTYRHALMGFWDHVGQRRGRLWWQATPRDLDSFLERGLSDNTRANLSGAVLLFYRWATRERLISRNPLAKATAVHQPEPIPRALELSQVGDLLDVVAGDDRMTLMVLLAYGAGLRCAEITNARVEDVRLQHRPVIVVRKGKGGRSRVIPLAPLVRDYLAVHLADRGRTGPLVEARRPDGEPTGRHLSASWVSKLLSRAMREAGLRDSGHSLRHTFATTLLEQGHGTNLRAVSRMLGHAQTSVTERFYTASYNEDAYQTAALLPDPRRSA